MDVIVELMQDKAAKGHIDFHPKPLNSHHKGEGHRIFGPFSSGLWWQMAHIMSGGKKTIACLIFYSDATEFYKSCGAHPVFGKHFIHDDVCFCWHIILFMAHDYNFLYWPLLGCSYPRELQGNIRIHQCCMETIGIDSCHQERSRKWWGWQHTVMCSFSCVLCCYTLLCTCIYYITFLCTCIY